MRILMLCPQISGSSFLVSHSYGKIAAKKHDVFFVGPTFGKKPFIEDDSIDVRYVEPVIKNPVQIGMINLFATNLVKLLKDFRGEYDVIHAFKLLPHTAPVAAAVKKITGTPFILTIDDYDSKSPSNPIKKFVLSLSEGAYKSADEITVSTKYLQRIYGGNLVYQVSDEKLFDPKKHTGKKIRKKYNLEDKIVITHVGTLHDFKGIDILIEAVRSLKRDDIKLILFESGENIEKYKRMSGDETIWVPPVNFFDVPEYVAAADIYVIPTKDTIYSRAETPRKIFDAMAMGRAIIATNLADVPKFLDDGKCGIIVKPGSMEELKKAISKLADDRNLRNRLGERARKHYLKTLSYKILEKQLLGIYSKIENKIRR